MQSMRKMISLQKIVAIFLMVVFAVADFGWVSLPAMAHKQTYILNQSIDKTTSQLQQTQEQLKQSQTQYQTNNHQIAVTKVVLTQTQQDIAAKEKQIADLDQQIADNKKILEAYLQEMSFGDPSDAMMSFIASGNVLSEFSGNFDGLVSAKSKVLDMIGQISQEESDLGDAKNQLAQKKAENEQALAAKQTQQVQVVATIQQAQATIAQLNSELSSLQSKLASLLGGGVTAKNIVDASKIASNATGVRKDFIIGELVVESDMGKFTGGCTYDKSKMGSTNLSIFKNICSGLSLNYKTQKVSCALSYGIGGAMGVAQFMPSTWAGYASRITAATGNNPPNPWSLVDGVTAMALYLKNRGADHKSGERTAAAAYYCGSNLSRTICQNYATKVLYWADNYGQLVGN